MTELENDLNRIKQEKLNKIIPENIKKGVSIFGVVGNMSSGTDTSDATATANDIKAGTTAYTATGKTEGTLTFDKFTPDYTNCLNKASQIEGVVPLENPYFSVIGTRLTDFRKLIIAIPQLDTSNVTNMSYMFNQCENLTAIPEFNTSKVTDMRSMFSGCTKLTSIPLLDTLKVTDMVYMFSNCTNLTAIPKLDTSKVTGMSYMFQNCINLTSVPLLDVSSVRRGLNGMFYGCPKLSDESLNNILQMCANAKTYTGTKTLKDQIGLSQEQVTKCATLPNWQAFLDAGWTTGY